MTSAQEIGSGYGSGSGDGDGSGDGSGSGSGDGDGDGSGSGSGDGDGEFSPPELRSLAAHLGPIPAGTLAFWKSDRDGRPCNNGTGGPYLKGSVQKIDGPLELCGKRALHATLNPEKWKGERLWLVVLRGEVIRDGDKLGALEREILGEVIR